MKSFKISQIQFQAQSTPQENCHLLFNYYKKTLKFKPDLICTPECSNLITGDKNHLFKFANFDKDCPILNMSKLFAKENKVFINIGSLLLKQKNKNKLVNRSFLINTNGKIQKYYDKIHMFDVSLNNKEIYKESNFFHSGKKIAFTKIKNIPLGLTICYDLRFPNLFRKLAKKGAHIILVPSAFTVPTGRDHWETLVKARAIENSSFIIATNMCGHHHTNRKTYGHSLLINPWGKIINKTFKNPNILNTKINLDEVQIARKKIPSLKYD